MSFLGLRHSAERPFLGSGSHSLQSAVRYASASCLSVQTPAVRDVRIVCAAVSAVSVVCAAVREFAE